MYFSRIQLKIIYFENDCKNVKCNFQKVIPKIVRNGTRDCICGEINYYVMGLINI